jgi:hypothetical protein
LFYIHDTILMKYGDQTQAGKIYFPLKVYPPWSNLMGT